MSKRAELKPVASLSLSCHASPSPRPLRRHSTASFVCSRPDWWGQLGACAEFGAQVGCDRIDA